MKDATKNQKGSESRDKFKLLHKKMMDKKCWALDSDLELVEKEPRPFVVARLDFKMPGDGIGFTEAISYNWLVNKLPQAYRVPVYIIEANKEFKTSDNTDDHRFTIMKLKSANHKPDPPEVELETLAENITWDALAEWELGLKRHRQKEVANLIKQGLWDNN